MWFRFRKSKNSNSHDFENSEEAFKLVVKLFTQLQKDLPYPWLMFGSGQLKKYLKQNGSWLPEPEFRFASGMMSDIWDIIRLSLINQESPGTYSQVKITEIFWSVNSYMEELSEDLKGNKEEREEFSECCTRGMFLVLGSNSEDLAQPFLFRLCVVWIHSRKNYLKSN